MPSIIMLRQAVPSNITDGETTGTFNVQAKSTTPATSDNSNLGLWFALLFVSGAGIFGITVYDRKRKATSKR